MSESCRTVGEPAKQDAAEKKTSKIPGEKQGQKSAPSSMARLPRRMGKGEKDMRNVALFYEKGDHDLAGRLVSLRRESQAEKVCPDTCYKFLGPFRVTFRLDLFDSAVRLQH